jgi:hypothetical protein
MTWLARWLQTTFDYNPTFPLSALALLAGVRLLSGDGALGGPLGELGVLGAFELALLALALGVLWPRRIAYETTSALIVFAVVRYAAPFVVIGVAADGAPGQAALLGAGLTALMVLKGEATVRRVGLDLAPWERVVDYACYGVLAVALPLLSERLAAWTGGVLSHGAARRIELLAWWSLGIGSLGLTLGLAGLGRDGPLRSRRPALVWRWLLLAGAAALLFNALWLAAGAPAPFALVPLVLGALALLVASLRAGGRAAPAWAAAAPAGAVAVVTFCPAERLLGAVPALTPAAAVVATAAVALAFLPRLTAPGQRGGALRGLAWVVAAAPLRFAPSALSLEAYLLAVAALVFALGVARRRDRQVALGGLFAGLLAADLVARSWLSLGWTAGGQLLLLVGSVLALQAALRREDDPSLGGATLRTAAALCTLPCAALAFAHGPAAVPWPGVVAGAALAVAGRRRQRGGLQAAGLAQGGGLVGARLLAGLSPGAALVALAFAGLPAGTWLAIRRERARRPVDHPEAEGSRGLEAPQAVAA